MIVRSFQLPEYYSEEDDSFVYNVEIPEPAILVYSLKDKTWSGETISFDEEESDWVTERTLSKEEATELATNLKLITNSDCGVVR